MSWEELEKEVKAYQRTIYRELSEKNLSRFEINKRVRDRVNRKFRSKNLALIKFDLHQILSVLSRPS